MTIFNQGWITLGGEPVTGRAPTQVLFHAEPGVEASPQQRGAVAHAYKLFCDAVKNSPFPDGYHIQHRTFPDGTKVQMTSNLNRHEVHVWIAGTANRTPIYRGFVIKPRSVGGAALAWVGFTTLLRNLGASWTKWRTGYRPGGSGSAPTFFVDDRSTQKISTQSDAKYRDVYALSRGVLYKNAERLAKFVADGRPVVLHRTDPFETPKAQYFATTDGGAISRRNDAGTADALYAWAPLFLSPGRTYEVGARPQTESLQLLALNVTSANAFQTKRQVATLLRAAPWLSVTSVADQQTDVPSPLFSSSGYTSVSTFTPSNPFFSPKHDDARTTYWIYPTYVYTPEMAMAGVVPPMLGPIGTLHGGGYAATTPLDRATYNKALTSGEPPHRLYPDIEARYSRSTSIDMIIEQGFTNWWNTHSGGAIWTADSQPGPVDVAAGYTYFRRPTGGPDSAGIFDGAQINSMMTETGGALAEHDISTSQTELDKLGIIYFATTDHTVNHRAATGSESRRNEPVAISGGGSSISQLIPGTTDPFTESHGELLDWTSLRPVDLSSWPDVHRETRTDTLNVSGYAKDFLFSDTENGVYVFFKTEITGTWLKQYSVEDGHETLSESGSLTATITLMMETPFGNFTGTVRTLDLGTYPTANFRAATDIPEHPTLIWRYVSPQLAFPIFAPKWQGQGSCPHIAYTTLDEAPVQRALASFRVQVLLLARPPFYPVPEVLDALTMRIPMGEGLIAAHFPGLYFGTAANLETEAFVLNASHPGTDVHGDVGITGGSPRSEFYRT